MGREAVSVCHMAGGVAEVKLHLDGTSLQLRGDISLDVARADIIDVLLVEEGLRIATHGPDIVLEFGKADAQRWQKALLKRPPTLAEKLGVAADSCAFVQGQTDDPALRKALADTTVADPANARFLLAIVVEEPDLHAASALAGAFPDKHIWMVYRKGKAAHIGDSKIRAHMRELGFIDSKSCAVSEELTATRYRWRPPVA